MARAYSGRGMYGRECLAFESMEEFVEAIQQDAIESADNGRPRILPVRGWEMDSMGLGVVIYNQRVSVAEGREYFADFFEDEDDEDDEDGGDSE